MARSLVIALTLASTALQGQQQHPLVGAWQIAFTAGMRVENGEATAIPGTGLLTVEAKGDSLIGTLVTDSIPGMARRPPSRLAGKATDGEATLLSYSTATINRNGVPSIVEVVNTWVLTATGETLSGTLARRIEGMDDMGREPTAVTGARRKG